MKLNKNYAGISFLYRKNGAVSTVMEIVMKEKVDGAVLQAAVNFTVSRHPYFKSSLQERGGDYYIAENEMPFEVKETLELRPLGSRELNFHLIDVTYYGKQIFVAFHHALCDGLGARRFVETLVCYYSELKYDISIENGDGTLPKPGDILDPFAYGLYPVDESIPAPETAKEGFHLPELPTQMPDDTDFRWAFTLDNDSLMTYSRSIGASPAIAVALLISKAIHNVHPDADKPIICNMANSMREGLGAENSFKNCVNSIRLPYCPCEEFSAQAKRYKAIIREHKRENHIRRGANSMIGLFHKLDSFKTLEEKKQVMAFFDTIHNDTFTLSYTGRLDLTECERFIESMHLYSGGNNDLLINMMSIGNTTTVNVIQSFDDESYVEAFLRLLAESGIDFKISGKITFTTPRDGIAETPAVETIRKRVDFFRQYADGLSKQQ